MTSEGFVMAMKGKVLLHRESPRKVRLLATAWFIVSRLGLEGELLLIGWAGRDAGSAWPRSGPRLTLVARQSVLRLGATACFDLLPEVPASISVAGRMVPATGHALLSDAHLPYALRVVASLPNGLSCRIAITRCPWIGEVIDGNRQPAANRHGAAED